MRMCRTHRMMFAELAEALLNQGDTRRAVAVLDKAEQELPGYNIPYDYTSATMACYYLECGETEKGAAILRQVAKSCSEYVTWGAALSKNQRAGVQRTIQQNGAILGFVLQQSERYHLSDITDDYSAAYMQFAR
jgi:diphthamide synthase (EF-2-diphthine--ammonia ligase)